MGIFEGIILGLVQGLTEFLPVSSSGHLALARRLINDPVLQQSPILFDVAVHAATLLAIVIYFRVEVLKLLRGLLITVLAISKRFRPRPESPAAAERRLFFYVLLASIPTAAIGLLLRDAVANELQDPVPVGLMLCLTGVILFMTRRYRTEGRPLKGMSPIDALVIGLMQGLSVLPGLSRSGSTIGAGIVLGLERRTAARFSFLIAVPAITAAAVLELPKLFEASATGLVAPAVAGAIVAFVTGYLAIAVLIRIVENRKLVWFCPYVWVVGVLAIVLGLMYG